MHDTSTHSYIHVTMSIYGQLLEYCYRPRTRPCKLQFVSYREHKSVHYDCCRSNKHVWGWDLWQRLCIAPVKQPWFTSLWAHPKRQNYPESGFSEVSLCWTSDNLPATIQMCFTSIKTHNSNTSHAHTGQVVVTSQIVIDAEQDETVLVT